MYHSFELDLIITREVSRFARNTVDTLQETRKLKKIGVEVYFTEDNIWTFNDEDGELKLTIMATLAQNESKKTSQRVKAGQLISFKNAVFYGNGNILGYDYNKFKKELTINEEQAKVVKEIYSMFLDGFGLSKIKYELEKKGYLTATGLNLWNVSGISRILRNAFYCGTIVYRKSYIPDYLEQKAKKNNGEVEQIIVEGKHTPLISKEDYNRAQEIMNLKVKKITETKCIGHGKARSIWTKKMRCSCGSTFNRRTYHKRTDKANSYCYYCYKQKNYGNLKTRSEKGLDTIDSCDVPFVQEWKLLLMSNVIFNTIWNDKERLIGIANEIIESSLKENEYNNEIDSEINELEVKLNGLKRKNEKLVDMYLNDMLEKSEFEPKKHVFDSTIEEINLKIKNLIDKKEGPKEILHKKIEILKNILNNNPNYSDGKVSDEIVDTFIEQIIVQRDSYIWKLNYFESLSNITKTEDSNNILLTRLVITNDDLEKYKINNDLFHKIKLKENLIIDICI